jgi:endonuclease/exonuclease/phosphatase family metal-dependent hydrolase
MSIGLFKKSLSSLALACLGFALSWPAQAIFSEKTGELKLLSLNVWGLPAPLGTMLLPRMERIVEAIQPYDIVLLQETFDSSTNRFAQISGYPYAVQEQNPGWGQVRSGLTTLSRWPIVKSDFRAFKRCYGTDCLARKGVLFTRIKHPELGYIDVYNTHYQSMQKQPAIDVRQQDNNAVLARFVFENNRYYPTLMGGDFNLYPDQAEYQDLQQRLPFLDTFRVKHPEHQGFTVHHDANPQAAMSSQRIDYIFFLQNARYQAQVQDSELRFTEPITGYMLSDHFGVATHLSLRGPVND